MATQRLQTAPLQDLRRATEILQILFRHGFGALFKRSALPAGVDPEGVDRSQANLPLAARIRNALEALGPTFVKLGQVLSTRADIVPDDLVDALKSLQDRTAPLPFATIREVVERELGRPLEELFERFDPEPLATASIAQVHRGRIRKGGRSIEVVCKVQRPGIEETMSSDLSLLYWLGRLLEETIEEVSAYSPTAIVEQFENAVSEELDFLHELQNIERARRNYANRPDLTVIPEPFPELSSRRVLTMTYLDGVKITAVKDDPRYDHAALRDRLVETAFKQVFEDGFFHGDPHPGNVFVLPDGRLGMLDYGLWGTLTSEQQDILVHWLTAIAAKSPATLARLTLKVGEVPLGFDRVAYERDVRALMDKYVGVELSDLDASSIIADSIDVIRRHRIKLPPDFAVLARATATLEGIVRELYPDLDFQAVILPYVQRLVLQRLDFTRAGPETMSLVLGLQTFVNEVPSQLEQLLGDLSSGRFQVTVGGEALEDLQTVGRTHGLRNALSILAGALIVALGLTLAPFATRWAPAGVPVVPLAFLFFLLLTLSGLGLTLLFPKGFRKIRISRWFFWRRPR